MTISELDLELKAPASRNLIIVFTDYMALQTIVIKSPSGL